MFNLNEGNRIVMAQMEGISPKVARRRRFEKSSEDTENKVRKTWLSR